MNPVHILACPLGAIDDSDMTRTLDKNPASNHRQPAARDRWQKHGLKRISSKMDAPRLTAS
jgi:hypothetical protein